jgi:hypothetical protein
MNRLIRRLSVLVDPLRVARCAIFHERLHKHMASTTHYSFWWCRVFHRKWSSRKSG